MIRSVASLAGLLVILTIGDDCLAQTGPPPPPASGGVVVEVDPNAWKKFESKEGRFVASFPGKPKAQSQSVNPHGVKLTARTHIVRTVIANYLVSYFDLPAVSDDPFTSKTLLDGGRDLALANMKGKLISEKDITIGGYPGRHTVVELSDQVIHARTYIVKNRVYQVTVVLRAFVNTSAEGNEFFSSIVNRFFDSFELAKEAK